MITFGGKLIDEVIDNATFTTGKVTEDKADMTLTFKYHYLSRLPYDDLDLISKKYRKDKDDNIQTKLVYVQARLGDESGEYIRPTDLRSFKTYKCKAMVAYDHRRTEISMMAVALLEPI